MHSITQRKKITSGVLCSSFNRTAKC